jgi:zinc transport system substrate-binding protein
LTVAGSVTVSPDVQPSALRLSEVRNKIAALGAVCVFAEPTFQPKLVAAVTEGTTARSGTLDPEGMALEPGSELYFELMQRLSANIKACLLPPA